MKKQKDRKNALMLYLINSFMKFVDKTREVDISYGLQQFLY